MDIVLPTAALRYLRARGVSINSGEFKRRYGQLRDVAFTVAQVSKISTLTKLNDSLIDAAAKGQGFNEWRAGIQVQVAASKIPAIIKKPPTNIKDKKYQWAEYMDTHSWAGCDGT
ncbi:hypothetical protein NQX30_05585 [Candidatus Persebacteraceae bacterium Df01]|jgi:hypothetical protein|uniref:Uncharacterized protein n=1 Tax=Candidatus Doriopsillibacter californiensis TaxID=2970740 RepID=A0ABT7QM93_9GAMM|nr:hypothetical protein [Candidatus Persebacteraceae bacterium Df01]